MLTYLGAQLERWRLGGFSCLFLKMTLIWENITLFVCIYWLNSHFKCNFKNIFKKNKKFFPAEPFFCMSCVKCLSKCPYSKKPVLPQKIPVCAPVTFNLTFHPNFHPSVLVFANLPFYRKLIQYNI